MHRPRPSDAFRWTVTLTRGSSDKRPAEEVARELDEIEARVAEIDVPLSYADELYALRAHIAMVRRRLNPAPPRQGPGGL